MVMVKAVLGVCNFFTLLSVLGLNVFYSLLQARGGNKCLEKIIGQT